MSVSCNSALHPCLSLAVHIQSVAALPASTSRAADRFAVAMTLAETTRLARSRGQTTHLAMLHHRLAQPLNVGVVADRSVERINTDHFEVLVRRVLPDPVAV